jgi:hypothetical protein
MKKSPLQNILKKVENHDLDVSQYEKEPVEEVAVVNEEKPPAKKKPKKTDVETSTDKGSALKIESQSQEKVESDKTGEGESSPSNSESIEPAYTVRNRRLFILGAIAGGLVAGFSICYIFFLMPLQNQIVKFTAAFSSGSSSSNQMKSDLSTTKLKQQEMETRYQAVTDQLESANQYIFLLRMKEQIAIAQLMVEQKEGLKARQSLSEIQNRFDQLKPFVMKKDVASAEKLELSIKNSIQHLVSDPESIKSDLTAISDQLNTIESTLFEPK